MLNKAHYSNPTIPEGINATLEHPLKEFAWLSIGVTTLLIALIMIVGWLGHILGPLIPFETEKRISDAIAFSIDDKRDRETQDYLQGIADRLTSVMPLREGMSVTLHILDSEEVNAFATLGGHIVVTQGLLNALPSENALAMVIAHEIAHIRERHVIRALGRGVLIGIALAMVTGASDSDLAGSILGQAGATAGLSFSRRQERAADRAAVYNLYALYGHAADATAFFELAEPFARYAPPDWLSTHPNRNKRIEAIQREIRLNGWATEHDTRPLPNPIRKSVRNTTEAC